MKKLFYLLLVLLVPSLVFASVTIVANVGSPYVCGDGFVRLDGFSNPVNNYVVARVYFAECASGCGYDGSNLVYSETLPNDNTVHPFSVMVEVVEGGTYNVYATLKKTTGQVGYTMHIQQHVIPACDADDLLDMQEDSISRLRDAT